MNLELIKAIVILPGTALVYILVQCSGSWPSRERPFHWRGSHDRGSGLPWCWVRPVSRSLCDGQAVSDRRRRHASAMGSAEETGCPGAVPPCRNPMITSVLLMLGAESLFFGSWHLAGWMLVFFAGQRGSISHWWRSGPLNGGSATPTASTRRTYRAGFRAGARGTPSTAEIGRAEFRRQVSSLAVSVPQAD